MAEVVLISTYEMGRQPFGIASPAGRLRSAGATVTVQDLAVSHLEEGPIRSADLIAFYVPMHTATRLAESALSRVKALNERAHICFYGLYAPMNESHLRDLGADSVIGGEFEQPLVDLYRRVTDGTAGSVTEVSLERRAFEVPDRTGLPPLEQYAHLDLGTGETRVVGYTETTRGCKHRCRHCPVVPVYNGRFVIVQPEVVLADVRQQVAAGAEHITFGDPDFFNGPAHGMRIVRQMHDEFPTLTYDVTIKVQHLVEHGRLLEELAETGCVLVTSAIESFDDATLERLDKGHTRDDVRRMLDALRDCGVPLNATFVPFTPWTTSQGYVDFLRTVGSLGLVDGVAPIQYAIRLLIPAGSRLLELPEVAQLAGPFDKAALSHPWAHPDPLIDELQREIVRVVEGGHARNHTRRRVYRDVWHAAHRLVTGVESDPPLEEVVPPATVPFLTEPWFC